MSLFGPLEVILMPKDTGLANMHELRRALVAWRYGLTREEVPLLEYIAEGLTDKEITQKLGVIQDKTTKNRVSLLFSKLGVNNRTRAAVIAVQFGLIPPKAQPPKAG